VATILRFGWVLREFNHHFFELPVIRDWFDWVLPINHFNSCCQDGRFSGVRHSINGTVDCCHTPPFLLPKLATKMVSFLFIDAPALTQIMMGSTAFNPDRKSAMSQFVPAISSSAFDDFFVVLPRF
jgi:hypothetical protein